VIVERSRVGFAFRKRLRPRAVVPGPLASEVWGQWRAFRPPRLPWMHTGLSRTADTRGGSSSSDGGSSGGSSNWRRQQRPSRLGAAQLIDRCGRLQYCLLGHCWVLDCGSASHAHIVPCCIHRRPAGHARTCLLTPLPPHRRAFVALQHGSSAQLTQSPCLLPRHAEPQPPPPPHSRHSSMTTLPFILPTDREELLRTAHADPKTLGKPRQITVSHLPRLPPLCAGCRPACWTSPSRPSAGPRGSAAPLTLLPALFNCLLSTACSQLPALLNSRCRPSCWSPPANNLPNSS